MNFHITLSPVRADGSMTLSKSGAILTIDGTEYDFGPLEDGDALPREAVECDRLASDVTRLGDTISLALVLPHGGNAPEETRFAEAHMVTEDGSVAMPPYDVEPEPEEETGA